MQIYTLYLILCLYFSNPFQHFFTRWVDIRLLFFFLGDIGKREISIRAHDKFEENEKGGEGHHHLKISIQNPRGLRHLRRNLGHVPSYFAGQHY